jgi:hypothetical protein
MRPILRARRSLVERHGRTAGTCLFNWTLGTAPGVVDAGRPTGGGQVQCVTDHMQNAYIEWRGGHNGTLCNSSVTVC